MGPGCVSPASDEMKSDSVSIMAEDEVLFDDVYELCEIIGK